MIGCVTPILSLLFLVDTGVMGDRECTFEFHGELQRLTCRRNEYCCKVGCCLSPSFQFYQLWYYWLMVIFMLVVCSGGQWWYKYWVGGGERSAGAPCVMMRGSNPPLGTAAPSRPRMGVLAQTSHAQLSTGVPTSFTLIHQICKPHHYHSRGDGKVPSPYDQIYGPPPSYESVIASGHPSTILPCYTPSPEPFAGSDPLGAMHHTPLRGICPPYTENRSDEPAHVEPTVHSENETSPRPVSTLREETTPSNESAQIADSNDNREVDVCNSETDDKTSNSPGQTLSLQSPEQTNNAAEPTTLSDTSQCLLHQQH